MDAVLFVLLPWLVLVSFVYFIKEGVIMFSFTKWIRGIQGKIAANYWNYMVGSSPEPVFYIIDEETQFSEYVPEPTHFTQGEKQYLQRVLADVINTWEDMRKEILYEAQYLKEQGCKRAAHMTFKEHRKMKAEIKKIVGIQNKIKHSLETRG